MCFTDPRKLASTVFPLLRATDLRRACQTPVSNPHVPSSAINLQVSRFQARALISDAARLLALRVQSGLGRQASINKRAPRRQMIGRQFAADWPLRVIAEVSGRASPTIRAQGAKGE